MEWRGLIAAISLLLSGCEGTKVNFELTVITQRDSTAVTGDADYRERSPQYGVQPPPSSK